jgi:hypothetical protein
MRVCTLVLSGAQCSLCGPCALGAQIPDLAAGPLVRPRYMHKDAFTYCKLAILRARCLLSRLNRETVYYHLQLEVMEVSSQAEVMRPTILLWWQDPRPLSIAVKPGCWPAGCTGAPIMQAEARLLSHKARMMQPRGIYRTAKLSMDAG